MIESKFGKRGVEEVDVALRERFFGEFEGRNDSKALYNTSWEDDAKDPDHTVGGVESANDVAERASAVVERYEKKYSGYTIVYVAHGDTLKILETAIRKLSASRHQDDSCDPRGSNCVKPYKTAEIRSLNSAYSALK